MPENESNESPEAIAEIAAVVETVETLTGTETAPEAAEASGPQTTSTTNTETVNTTNTETLITEPTETPAPETAAAQVPATETPATQTPAAEAPQAAVTPETPAVTDNNAENPGITFTDLGLPEGIVRKLAQNGVTSPFPIQAATIPDALVSKDILGRGRTGSGKTLSFGLPMLATLTGGHTEKKKPRGIILTPTRELAMQVADALQPYGDVLGLKMKVVCGGTSMSNQIYALERGVDILVATLVSCATSSTAAPPR